MALLEVTKCDIFVYNTENHLIMFKYFNQIPWIHTVQCTGHISPPFTTDSFVSPLLTKNLNILQVSGVRLGISSQVTPEAGMWKSVTDEHVWA
jgi:hypothetical protein